MSAKSPRSGVAHISPRTSAAKPQANLNHFSALSPDFAPNMLPDDTTKRSLIVYSRDQLLRLARRSDGNNHPPPVGMGALETWFGVSSTPAPAASSDETSASASIESASGRRQGGFGEGFGYGGGIGGRGLGGRGGRNPGLKRQQHDGARNVPAPPVPGRDHLNAMFSKLSARNPNEVASRPQDRRDRRRDDEWRRNGESSRRPYAPPGDDDATPAWLDDSSTGGTEAPHAPGDPRFGAGQADDFSSIPPSRPGHQGAAEPTQRSGKQLVSFFGGTSAPVAAETPAPRNKVFDSANYLLPQRAQASPSDATQMPQVASQAPVVQSRFQKFFGNSAVSTLTNEQPARRPAEVPPMANHPASMTRGPPSGFSPPVVDRPSSGSGPDHFSRLMGILSSNSPHVNPVGSTNHSDMNHGVPLHVPFGVSPPPVPPPGFPGPSPPPNFIPPAFSGISAQDLLHNQTAGMRYSEPGPGMSQGPPLGYPLSPPAPPAFNGGMPPQTQADTRFPHYGPPPPGYTSPPQFRPPGAHQQDMLASLFAGLGRPSGPQ